jgi:hypothetical protein
METSSGSAEAIGSGFSINIIPKEGGNDFKGIVLRDRRGTGVPEQQLL